MRSMVSCATAGYLRRLCLRSRVSLRTLQEFRCAAGPNLLRAIPGVLRRGLEGLPRLRVAVVVEALYQAVRIGAAGAAPQSSVSFWTHMAAPGNDAYATLGSLA